MKICFNNSAPMCGTCIHFNPMDSVLQYGLCRYLTLEGCYKVLSFNNYGQYTDSKGNIRFGAIVSATYYKDSPHCPCYGARYLYEVLK